MKSHPNIIFIFSDQQRWDTIGAYGQKLPLTPNIDRMAETGILFENAFTMQPVCGPARAALQTGLYPTATGCFRNALALPESQMNLAHRLNRCGYQTAYVGKWHLASNEHLSLGAQDRKPFDYKTLPVPEHLRGGYRDFWIASDVLEFTSHGYGGHMFDSEGRKREWGEDTYRVDATTGFVREFLDQANRDKPFFLMVSYIEPHHQNDRDRYEGPHGSEEKWKEYEVPDDLQGAAGDWKENYPDYLGAINSLDQAVGNIRTWLEERGLADNTLLIYSSDHGSHFRTRNKEYKRACHAGCTHIPLIISGPGFTGGKRVDDMVSLLDVTPTILKAAGCEEPENLHGRPLQQLVSNNKPADWPQEVFIQISESQVGRCIRTRDWCYSVSAPDKDGWRDASSTSYVEEYLYDLRRDPAEKNNLVNDPSLDGIRTKLRETLCRRMRQAGEAIPEIRPKFNS